MNNEVKLKGLAGLAHLLSPGADWAYDDAARNVRDYVKEQTLALAAKDRDLQEAAHNALMLEASAAAFQRVAEQRQGEIERLRRAVEWCLQSGAQRWAGDISRLAYDPEQRLYTMQRCDVPAELVGIIKPTTGASNG